MKNYWNLMLMIALLIVGSVQAALPVAEGLVMHFDATAITGAEDGDPIGTWSDLSGNGSHATQATADNMPTYVVMNPDFKGHPTLHFDGSNDWLDLPSGTSCPINVNDFTLFIVAKYDDNSSSSHYLCSGNSPRLRMLVDHGIGYDFAWRVGNSTWNGLHTASDTDVHVFAAKVGAEVLEGLVDDISAGTISQTESGQPDNFNLGVSGGESSGWFVGDIAEVALYNRALTSAQVTAVNDHLMQKYTDDVLSATNPTDDQKNVPAGDVTLQWDGAEDPANPGQLDPDVLKHYVYVDMDRTDNDANLLYVGEVVVSDWSNRAASYGPISFVKDQKVSWQIREGLEDPNDPGIALEPDDPNNWLWGPVWTFDMELTVPEIYDITPEAQTVHLSDDATITVTGSNIDYYTWYKDTGTTPLSDGADYSGTDTAVLTILDVDIADEGTYTCVVTNDETPDANDVASSYLLAARLVSWWKLDSDLSDSVQAIIPGAPEFDGSAADPGSFTVGNGLDGGDSAYFEEGSTTYPALRIDGTEDYFNFYDKGMTVNAWIKTDTAMGAWPPIISKRDADGDGWVLFLDGDKQISARMAGTSLYGGGPALNDGEWHMVTMTYDGTTMAIYADGEPVTSGDYGSDADINTAAIVLGRWTDDTVSQFEDNIDDVKVYNYALTFEEVFAEYANLKPGVWVCQETAAMVYDTNDDCVIDLTDFAAWASTWLACDRYPASECPQ